MQAAWVQSQQAPFFVPAQQVIALGAALVPPMVWLRTEAIGSQAAKQSAHIILSRGACKWSYTYAQTDRCLLCPCTDQMRLVLLVSVDTV